MSIPENWTFLTNHTHVLLCVLREPEIRMREVGQKVGITERGVQKIVADLVQEKYLVKIKEGRRNRYEVNRELPLRHPLEAHRSLAALLDVLGDEP